MAEESNNDMEMQDAFKEFGPTDQKRSEKTKDGTDIEHAMLDEDKMAAGGSDGPTATTTMQGIFNMMQDMQRQIHEITAMQEGQKSKKDMPVSPRAQKFRDKVYSTRKHPVRDHSLSESSVEEDEESNLDDEVLESDYEHRNSRDRASDDSEKHNTQSRSRQKSKRKEDSKNKDDNIPPKKVRVEKNSPASDANQGNSEPLGFAEQFESKVEDVGDSVFPWLARMVNKMFYAPNIEKVKEIQGEIKIPSNLYIETPRVNPEIWNRADVSQKNTDVKLQHVLKRQAEAATLLTQLVDRIMIEKEAADEEMKKEKEKLALEICKILALLGAAAKDANDGRRKNLNYAVSDHALRTQLGEEPKVVDGVPPTYLFGDNLSEKIKVAEDNSKLERRMKGSYDQSGYKRDRKNYNRSDYNSYRPKYNKSNRYNKNKSSQDSKSDNRQRQSDDYDKRY